MKQNNSLKFQKIGLSGGIGAGKSTVSERLRFLGAKITDADKISKTALDTFGPCYNDVIALFGTEIVRADASLDRAVIAQKIFSNESLRLALNEIIHPYVLKTMHEQCDSYLNEDPNAIVVFDVPLLIECGAYKDMDKNIIVIADDLARIHRICKRNGTTPDEAKSRIRSQIPQEEQCTYADYVIDNSGTLEELYRQVDAVFAALRGGAE